MVPPRFHPVVQTTAIGCTGHYGGQECVIVFRKSQIECQYAVVLEFDLFGDSFLKNLNR